MSELRKRGKRIASVITFADLVEFIHDVDGECYIENLPIERKLIRYNYAFY